MTVIRDIFTAYRGPGADTDIRRVAAIRRTYPSAYAAVLMGCATKQLRLLRPLWEDKFPCLEMLDRALKKLIDAGKVPELLDAQSKNAEFLIETEYRAVA
jgi:hypothetical protein